MQTMKELVCTICESVTNINADFAIRKNNSEVLNKSGDYTNSYKFDGAHNKYTSENDYITSCQVSIYFI